MAPAVLTSNTTNNTTLPATDAATMKTMLLSEYNEMVHRESRLKAELTRTIIDYNQQCDDYDLLEMNFMQIQANALNPTQTAKYDTEITIHQQKLQLISDEYAQKATEITHLADIVDHSSRALERNSSLVSDVLSPAVLKTQDTMHQLQVRIKSFHLTCVEKQQYHEDLDKKIRSMQELMQKCDNVDKMDKEHQKALAVEVQRNYKLTEQNDKIVEQMRTIQQTEQHNRQASHEIGCIKKDLELYAGRLEAMKENAVDIRIQEENNKKTELRLQNELAVMISSYAD